jgi:hypothetical protein
VEVAVARPPAFARLWAAAETRRGAAVLVGGLMLASFVSRALLAQKVLAPWELPDELLYAETSRNFLSSLHYVFRDHSAALRTIYPALISPAWLVGSVHTSYVLVKVINAALMTLGAIPLYLWARRLVAPLWAVLVVVLYLAMPGFVYSAEILTENAFLPATMLAFLAMAVALERPSIGLQLLALGAIALATAARLQGIVFLLVFPTAIGLVLLLDAIAAAPAERRSIVMAKVRRFWPSLVVVVVVAASYAVFELARGNGLSRGLGTYQQISSAHYAARPAFRWILNHFGELAFSVGLIPVSALIVLLGLACRRATAPRAGERAFLAVTTASVFWVVIQVGLFASRFSLRIEERYMFNLAPALFLALVVWLARGLPRPPALTAAAVLVPVVFLLVIPYRIVLSQSLFNDTYGLIPVWRLMERLGSVDDAKLVLAAGALAGGLLFAAVPRRAAIFAIPVSLLAFLVVSTNSVLGTVEHLSSAARHAGALQGDPSWIDHSIGKKRRVELLYTEDFADPHVAWQAEFWNRSVRRLFGLSAQDPSIPDLSAKLGGGGKLILGAPPGSPDRSPHYVLTTRTVDVDGSRVASAGQLVLWRVGSPLRLRSIVDGVTPDGYTGATATYTRYVVPPGATHVDVTVSRPGFWPVPTARVVAAVGPVPTEGSETRMSRVWARRATLVRAGQTALIRLPIRRGAFRVRLSVSPTFSPSQFGFADDTRQLGAKARFVVR